MGDYATYQDIETRLDTYDVTFNPPSTNISQAECENIIVSNENVINGILKALGYPTIPATGTRDVSMLEGYVSDKVAAEIWLIVFEGQEPPFRVRNWLENWNAFINRLRKGEQALYDQDAVTVVAKRIQMGTVTLNASKWTESDLTTPYDLNDLG